ncbi:MAG: undecaprenyl/decaprenyl-phosphate alpha-N-acetylglucosaminyl 1-phosphate transferase, partial [Thermicanus sp.]|nr:undecaprenyl/decaprenyl-phosphate alpha-N-acetylglucosaminyl 1-phosphate transferase [Thermicanus sp.]
MTGYMAVFLLGIVTTFLSTPLVKKLAVRIGAVDKPNARKVHHRLMPRLGGLSIYLGFLASTIWLVRDYKVVSAILIASSVVVLTGILDDKYQLKPIYKLLGQVIAALVIVFFDVQ